MDNDTIENLDYIAEQIYKNPPGEVNSIQLELEEQSAMIAEDVGVANYIFNILYLITIKGIKILYGHTNIMDLSEDQYKIIEKYVNSYGYKINVYANDTIYTPWELLKRDIQIVRINISFDKF